MDDDSDGEPIIDLARKQQKLTETILQDPQEAWVLLQSDPAMVLALSGVKRQLESSDQESVHEFFEEYDRHVKLIFGQESPLDRYGIALTCEFITEYWRKSMSSTNMNSLNEAIMKKMAILLEATEQLPEGYEKTVTSRIVDFSTKRVIDFADYDRNKGEEHIDDLVHPLEGMIDSIVDGQDINQILSLAYFGSASTESMEVFRNKIAEILLEKLKNKFDDFPEEEKFKIAPYLGVFKNIVSPTEEEKS